MPHPNLSRINSILRLRIFCRLWMRSSDWFAKEKECNDSVGNLSRSSQDPKVGEVGGRERELTRVPGTETERIEVGIINVCAPGGGSTCWRIRRRPDVYRWSPSPMATGFLEKVQL